MSVNKVNVFRQVPRIRGLDHDQTAPSISATSRNPDRPSARSVNGRSTGHWNVDTWMAPTTFAIATGGYAVVFIIAIESAAFIPAGAGAGSSVIRTVVITKVGNG